MKLKNVLQPVGFEVAFSQNNFSDLEVRLLRRLQNEKIQNLEAKKSAFFINLIWTGGGGAESAPLRFSSITPKRQEILKRNFLTLTLHL